MKKLFTFMLTALMLIASANVFADFTEGGVTYTVLGTMTVKASGVTSSATDVTIPAKVQNGYYSVISIASGFCTNNSKITGITIDATYMSEIPVLCSNCANLDYVSIFGGNTNLIVNGGCISDCPKLNAVRFPKAKLIYSTAVTNCAKLTHVTFDDVSVIGHQVIYNCPSVNYITWESDVKDLKCRNSSGSEVALSNVTNTNPFANLRSQITKIDLDGQYVPAHLFRNMTALTELKMYSGLEEIGQYAFTGCTSLTKFTPYYATNLKVIHDYAFNYCAISNDVYFLNNPNLYHIGVHAFDGYQGKSITIQCGGSSNGGLIICGYAFANSPYLNDISLSGHINYIYESAFSSCPNIEKVSIYTENVWTQSYSTSGGPFANKSNLKTVKLSGYFRAPNYLFAGSGVENAEIKCQGGVEQNTFYNCQSLKTLTWDVTMPSSSFTFSPFDLSPITTLTIGENVTELTNNLFKGISSLKAITSNAVTPPTLGTDVFAGCNNGNLRTLDLTVPSGSESQYKAAEGWCEFYGTCGGDEAVDEVQGDMVQCTKVIENGQLYILRDGKVFNLQGAQVK